MDINTIITTWIAPIVTGVIVVVVTTGIGKIVSIWWKNRTFLKNRDRGNEKYIDNINVFVTYKNFQELEKGLMEIVKQKNNESLKKIEEEEFE